MLDGSNFRLNYKAYDNTSTSFTIESTNWEALKDRSYLTFNLDQTFQHYQDKQDISNNYYSGTYLFHLGKAARKYFIHSLDQYHISTDTLEAYYKREPYYNEHNLVCLILQNDACYMNAKNILRIPVSTVYLGFLLSDGSDVYLELENLYTGDLSLFKKVDH